MEFLGDQTRTSRCQIASLAFEWFRSNTPSVVGVRWWFCFGMCFRPDKREAPSTEYNRHWSVNNCHVVAQCKSQVKNVSMNGEY